MSLTIVLVTQHGGEGFPNISPRFYAAAAEKCSAVALQIGEVPNVSELPLPSSAINPEYLPEEVQTRFMQGDTIFADGNDILYAFEKYLGELGLSSQNTNSAIARIYTWDTKGNCWKQPDRRHIHTE